MPSVASEAKPPAVNPPLPQAPRPLPAPDRAPASPFESLLDNGAQGAATPAPQPPPEGRKPAKAERSQPKQPTAPSKDNKPVKHANRAKTAHADNPAGAEKPAKTEQTTTIDKADETDVIGKIAADLNVAEAKTDGDDNTNTDGNKTDVKTEAVADAKTDTQAAADGSLTPPNIDKPAVVAAAVNIAPAPAPTDTVPAPSKDDATVTAPAPAPTPTPVLAPVLAPAPTPAPVTAEVATALAPAGDAVTQTTPAEQLVEAVAADAPKGKPAALVPAQDDAGKPADETDDSNAPPKTAHAAQGDGKPQAADDSDKPAIARARGEAPANGKGAATPDAQQPAANANANATTAKPSADVLQTLAVNPPPHNAAATAANAAPAAASALQLAAQAPVPLAGVTVAIAGKALEGKHHFEIRLDPPELGRIEVRLDVDRDGQVTSHLIAHRADTLDLLRRDAAGLQRALQDAGLKTADNGLQFSLHDQSTGRQQDAAGSPAAARLVVEDETLKVVEPTPSGYARLARLRGGLDIMV